MKKTLTTLALLASAAFVFAVGQPQTTCPVMQGSPVNPDLYVDAAGYRVYVCCKGCQAAVTADPDKYVTQLQAVGVEQEKTPAAPKVE